MFHPYLRKTLLLLLLVAFCAPAALAASRLNGTYQGNVAYQRTVKRGVITCPGHYSYLSMVVSKLKVTGRTATGTINTTLGNKRFRGRVRGNSITATYNFKGVYYGLRWKLVIALSNITDTSATGRLENWAAKSARAYCRDIFSGTISKVQ